MSLTALVRFEFSDANSLEQASDQMRDIQEWAESIGVRVKYGHVEDSTTIELPRYRKEKGGAA